MTDFIIKRGSGLGPWWLTRDFPYATWGPRHSAKRYTSKEQAIRAAERLGNADLVTIESVVAPQPGTTATRLRDMVAPNVDR